MENIVVQLQESADISKESPHDAQETGEQSGSSHSEAVGYKILSFLAKEFQRFNESNEAEVGASNRERGHNENSSRKRQRLNENVSPPLTPLVLDYPPPRLQLDDLEILFDIYFSHLHPWIPMLHQGRLRRRLRDPAERPKLEVVLQAMILISSRFISSDENPAKHSVFIKDASSSEQLRSWIVSNATSAMCLESLQALIMVSFNDVSIQELISPLPLKFL